MPQVSSQGSMSALPFHATNSNFSEGSCVIPLCSLLFSKHFLRESAALAIECESLLGCLTQRQVWDATPMRCRCPLASVVGFKGRSPLLPQGAQVGQADTCAYSYEPYRFNTQQSLQHSAPPESQPTRHNIEQRDAGSQGVLLRSEEEPTPPRKTSVSGHLDYPNVNLHTTLLVYVSLFLVGGNNVIRWFVAVCGGGFGRACPLGRVRELQWRCVAGSRPDGLILSSCGVPEPVSGLVVVV